MARIIVTAEQTNDVLLSEQVLPVHIEDTHAAECFLDRLEWAIREAEPETLQRDQGAAVVG